MSIQGTKIPPPWFGWLGYEYDDIPNVNSDYYNLF